MARASFQVLILPYRKTGESFEFAVFSRSESDCRQAIAGGESGETPMKAAKREAFEEAGILPGIDFIALDSVCSIPVVHFRDIENRNENLYVIPEYSFGVDCAEREIIISHKHFEIEWLSYAEAFQKFTYDSNRTALWELNQKLGGLKPREKAF
ncbi:MAG: NUDIX pyrophosphatase [Pyrinomonadaceae bacterium]